jgi:PA14 domain
MWLLKRKEYCAIKMIEQYFLVAIFIFPFRVHAQNDNKAFGDSIFITNGLTGKIYLLPFNTRALPGFDTMKSVGTIYADSINIPLRSWSAGFPGLRDRFEWFGIEYTGFFKANKEGEYVFRLLSDDGSKLFIDDSLIINNDGLHGAFAKTGKITLDDSRHSIKIQYFQGPRYQIALQLFASVNSSKEEIFPGNNFILYTESPHDNKLYYFLIPGGLILLFLIFVFWRRNKKKKPESDKKLHS